MPGPLGARDAVPGRLMLFRRAELDGIRSGAVTLAFRRWRRPSVRAGGTLLTPVGQLEVRSVEVVALDDVTDADAARAGYASRAALVRDLGRRPDGDVHRIQLGSMRPDPRVALRATVATAAAEMAAVRERLQRLDARSAVGPWTARTLEQLRAHPGVRAGDLCRMVGREKEAFKLDVRKLKNLGLTESLGTGYRLSPRGEALVAALLGDPGSSPA